MVGLPGRVERGTLPLDLELLPRLDAVRCEAEFQQRLEELRAAQARKPTFIDRLATAGL